MLKEVDTSSMVCDVLVLDASTGTRYLSIQVLQAAVTIGAFLERAYESVGNRIESKSDYKPHF
jgi:hypothetical protein